MPAGIGHDIGIRQTGADEHGGHNGAARQRQDRVNGPVPHVGCEDEQPRRRHLLLSDGLRVRRAHDRRGPARIQSRPDQPQDEENADRDGPPAMLPRQPSREDDRRQSVRADDVAVEEDAVDEAEEDHPQPAAPHEASRVHGGPLVGPGDLSGRRLAPCPRPIQTPEVGVRTALDPPVDHGDQSETEQHGEERVDTIGDQQGPHPDPDRVRHVRHAPGAGGRLPTGRVRIRDREPHGHVGPRDEQEHEAPGHIGRRIAHAPRTSE